MEHILAAIAILLFGGFIFILYLDIKGRHLLDKEIAAIKVLQEKSKQDRLLSVFKNHEQELKNNEREKALWIEEMKAKFKKIETRPMAVDDQEEILIKVFGSLSRYKRMRARYQIK